MPSGDFSSEGGLLPFRDVMRHKYSIKIPKQHAILFRIDWKTHSCKSPFVMGDTFLRYRPVNIGVATAKLLVRNGSTPSPELRNRTTTFDGLRS